VRATAALPGCDRGVGVGEDFRMVRQKVSDSGGWLLLRVTAAYRAATAPKEHVMSKIYAPDPTTDTIASVIWGPNGVCTTVPQ
jgi:hypothetical protein